MYARTVPAWRCPRQAARTSPGRPRRPARLRSTSRRSRATQRPAAPRPSRCRSGTHLHACRCARVADGNAEPVTAASQLRSASSCAVPCGSRCDGSGPHRPQPSHHHRPAFVSLWNAVAYPTLRPLRAVWLGCELTADVGRERHRRRHRARCVEARAALCDARHGGQAVRAVQQHLPRCRALQPASGGGGGGMS